MHANLLDTQPQQQQQQQQQQPDHPTTQSPNHPITQPTNQPASLPANQPTTATATSTRGSTRKMQRKGTAKRQERHDDDGYNWVVAVNNQRGSKQSVIAWKTNFLKLKVFQTTRLFEAKVFHAHEKQTFQFGRVAVSCFNPKQRFCRIVCFRTQNKCFRNKRFQNKRFLKNKQTTRKKGLFSRF